MEKNEKKARKKNMSGPFLLHKVLSINYMILYPMFEENMHTPLIFLYM